MKNVAILFPVGMTRTTLWKRSPKEIINRVGDIVGGYSLDRHCWGAFLFDVLPSPELKTQERETTSSSTCGIPRPGCILMIISTGKHSRRASSCRKGIPSSAAMCGSKRGISQKGERNEEVPWRLISSALRGAAGRRITISWNNVGSLRSAFLPGKRPWLR